MVIILHNTILLKTNFWILVWYREVFKWRSFTFFSNTSTDLFSGIFFRNQNNYANKVFILWNNIQCVSNLSWIYWQCKLKHEMNRIFVQIYLKLSTVSRICIFITTTGTTGYEASLMMKNSCSEPCSKCPDNGLYHFVPDFPRNSGLI